MMRPMALLARTIDPTRIILDESGGFADGANFYLPSRKILQQNLMIFTTIRVGKYLKIGLVLFFVGI